LHEKETSREVKVMMQIKWIHSLVTLITSAIQR